MKIGYYQFDVKHKDKLANLEKVAGALSGIAADLIILPELFTTGILFDTAEEIKELAESVPNGPTCQRLIQIAHENNLYIAGSILEENAGFIYNTAVVVGPSGYIGKQRKVHLPDCEKPFFTSGTEHQIFDINGVKVGLMICFDCWFPEMARSLTKKGAQIICHTANIESQNTLDVVRVRAMENGVYLVCSNRLGTESNQEQTYNFCGKSRVMDSKGNILAESSNGVEEVRVVEINPESGLELSDCRDMAAELSIYKKEETLAK